MNKFSFQNLRVYNDLTRFIASSEEIVSDWNKAHAIADHLYRSSEGAVVCLAEACRQKRLLAKQQAADHCAGLILECAACFDLARIKTLCSDTETTAMKDQLGSVFRQLIALRHSWEKLEIQEEESEYEVTHVFNHERLEVYQFALQINEKLRGMQIFERLSRGDFRHLDEPATSLLLNIAEGNGRFAHYDHSRFLEIANQATTKLAARLEVGALRKTIEKAAADEIIELPVSIDRMTAKLAGVWREKRRREVVLNDDLETGSGQGSGQGL